MVGDDILALNKVSHEPITLLIDSPGGDVATGFLLYDLIRMSPSPIITIGQNCSSMATVLLAAGVKRYVFPHGQLMLHLPSGALSGTVDEIDIRRSVLQKIKNELVNCYVECGVTAGLPNGDLDKDKIHAKILKDIKEEFWVADAEESIRYGLVDAIVSPEILFGLESDLLHPDWKVRQV